MPTNEEMSKAFGALLRKKRIMAGMSQDNVAQEIGVTFQQVQKYENGTNRISLPRLVQMANVIGFNPADMFDIGEISAAREIPLTRKNLEVVKVMALLPGHAFDSIFKLIKALVSETPVATNSKL